MPDYMIEWICPDCGWNSKGACYRELCVNCGGKLDNNISKEWDDISAEWEEME
jgi:ribosomal protein L37AE/L43A